MRIHKTKHVKYVCKDTIWIKVTDMSGTTRLINVKNILQIWTTVAGDTIIQVTTDEDTGKIRIKGNILDKLSILIANTQTDGIYELIQ